MLPMRRVSQPGAWFNRGPSSERTDLPGCRGRQISNPQPNPQFVVSCTSYGYFGSPRVLVVVVKPIPAKLSRQLEGYSVVRVSQSYHTSHKNFKQLNPASQNSRAFSRPQKLRRLRARFASRSRGQQSQCHRVRTNWSTHVGHSSCDFVSRLSLLRSARAVGQAVTPDLSRNCPFEVKLFRLSWQHQSGVEWTFVTAAHLLCTLAHALASPNIRDSGNFKTAKTTCSDATEVLRHRFPGSRTE